MVHERLSHDEVADADGHRFRYELVAEHMRQGDRVLDVACGIGYGAEILADHAPPHTYRGIDRDGVDARYLKYGWFKHADLNTWRPAVCDYDIAVSFETLEHLENPQHLANVIMDARLLMFVSVPTVPTKHTNPYHLHDFTVDDVIEMFAEVTCVDVIAQPEELSHIFIFRKGRA